MILLIQYFPHPHLIFFFFFFGGGSGGSCYLFCCCFFSSSFPEHSVFSLEAASSKMTLHSASEQTHCVVSVRARVCVLFIFIFTAILFVHSQLKNGTNVKYPWSCLWHEAKKTNSIIDYALSPLKLSFVEGEWNCILWKQDARSKQVREGVLRRVICALFTFDFQFRLPEWQLFPWHVLLWAESRWCFCRVLLRSLPSQLNDGDSKHFYVAAWDKR